MLFAALAALLAPARAHAGPTTPLCCPLLPTVAFSADLDEDGVGDVATVGDGSIEVWLSSEAAPVVLHGSHHALSVRAADIDHDGDTDLVSLSRHGGIRFWRNDGFGTFTATTHIRPRAPAWPLGIQPGFAGVSSDSSSSSPAVVLPGGASPCAVAPAARVARCTHRLAVSTHPEFVPLSAALAHTPSRAPPVVARS